MPNPFAGLITTQFKTLHKQLIQSLDESCSVPCRLVYTGTKFEDCANCSFNPIGQKPGNPYFGGGGGAPFVNTNDCKVCNGAGKIAVEVTEDVNLIVLWNYKKFINYGGGVPEGDCQTFCEIELTPKLKNASHVIFNTDIEAYKGHKFVRVSEPEPCGFGQAPFIYTTWRKSG